MNSLWAAMDPNSSGQVTKAQFEADFGAGGTNTQAADAVFSQIDKNGTGSISESQLASALKGAGHHHGHHMHGSGGDAADALTGSSSSQGTDSTGTTDPLLQALQGASTSSSTNNNGSTSTTITYADGSTVTMTTPAGATSGSTSSTNAAASTSSSVQQSTFNMLEQMIQRQANALAASTTQAVSVTA
ncbi:MAG: hypothetical protein ACLP8B_22505 [Xanthobacteraceae bacterium]|jgi:hypothetical protein